MLDLPRSAAAHHHGPEGPRRVRSAPLACGQGGQRGSGVVGGWRGKRSRVARPRPLCGPRVTVAAAQKRRALPRGRARRTRRRVAHGARVVTERTTCTSAGASLGGAPAQATATSSPPLPPPRPASAAGQRGEHSHTAGGHSRAVRAWATTRSPSLSLSIPALAAPPPLPPLYCSLYAFKSGSLPGAGGAAEAAGGCAAAGSACAAPAASTAGSVAADTAGCAAAPQAAAALAAFISSVSNVPGGGGGGVRGVSGFPASTPLICARGARG